MGDKNFIRFSESVKIKKEMHVAGVTVRLLIADCTGTVYFTDLLLQGGSVSTGWIGHVCEIQWTLDG